MNTIMEQTKLIIIITFNNN